MLVFVYVYVFVCDCIYCICMPTRACVYLTCMLVCVSFYLYVQLCACAHEQLCPAGRQATQEALKGLWSSHYGGARGK